MQQLLSYYHNKKVFITGHTGFKGTWLMAVLHTLGAKVKGYALDPEYNNGLFDLLKPLKIAENVIADIRDRKKLTEALVSFQPDYIFHLAAQPLVRRSYEIPAETFEINVTGTANLLEALTQLNKKCIAIIITTDKVYENKEKDILYKEDDTLGGYDPYSASKACAELVVNSFRHSFFNQEEYESHKKSLATVRAGNVIGGGDWKKDRIIPDIIRSLMKNEKIIIRNPQSVRPWQHVLEPLAGYLMLGGLLYESPHQFSTVYNFGPFPEDHLTVKELTEAAIHFWGNGDWENISEANPLHEASLLKLNITRAMKELNWEPKLNALQSIEWTVNWYKQPVNKQAEYTFQQINTYFAL